LSKIYLGTDHTDNIEKILHYFELSSSEIILCIAKILTKNNGDSYNTTLINSMDLNFLEQAEENNLIIINETLTAFNEILRATTISLWDANQQKTHLLEASQKLNAKLKADQTSSTMVATLLAINKAMANMALNNMANDATQLRISILEIQLQQQSQTSKEILTNNLPPLNQRTLLILYHIAPKIIKIRLRIHEEAKNKNYTGIPILYKLTQHNHHNPPNQMFPNSTTLNSFLRTSPQTSNISQIPFQPLSSFQQPNKPPNPFTLLIQQKPKGY